MQAANPVAGYMNGMPAPFFRRFDLPWSPSEEMEQRFRRILRSMIIVFAVLSVVVPFLPSHRAAVNTDSLPERVVKLVMEPPPPPPPPPPPKIEPKALEKVPVPLKPVDPRVKAQKSGLLANIDELAALRDQNDLDKFAKNQIKTNNPGDVSTVQRSILTSKAGGTSGGITTSALSSGLAAGSGSLNGFSTAQVKDPTLASGAGGATRSGGSGKASRSAEEIALVFDKNKGAIYALYTRALRDTPAMQGKVVVELSISPGGDVTAARILSSEMNDPAFEAKLLARIRLFKFDAKDVAPLTTTKPIEFFPA
jgi:periplasmic protein TonB